MSITKALKDLIAAFGGSAAQVPNRIDKLIGRLADVVEAGGGSGGDALPAVTADDNGKVLTVSGGEWGAVPPAAPDVVRIPFTLTMDMETGEISGTTTASLADALAAKAAGKILIADAALDLGANGTQYFNAVMSGHTGSGASLEAIATGLSQSADKLELYAIQWTELGVTVVGRKTAVSDQ